jgi:hypothetical protein
MVRWNSRNSLEIVVTFGSVGCLACVVFSRMASAQDKHSPPTPEPLAVFDGQPVDENQLPADDQAPGASNGFESEAAGGGGE